MTRTRAIGVFGLVLGLSGCAGTHHHHHAASQFGPQVAPSAFGTDCGCETHGHVHAPAPMPNGAVPPAQVAPARPAAVVATTTARPAPPSTSTLPPSSRPIAVPAPPPSSRPIAVPAPAGVVHYLPMFDDAGTIVRSAWNSPPPDFLGVRTALASDWPSTSELPQAPGDLDLAPPGQLPISSPRSPAPASLPLPPGWLPSPPTPDKVTPARWGQLEPRQDVVPASVVVSLPEAGSRGNAASPATGSKPGSRPGASQASQTIGLEYIAPASLAGRPRWDPSAAHALPLQDPGGSSSWVSQLALTQSAPSAPNAGADRVKPMPREVVPAGHDSVVSRFVRRVRGAGRAFLEPELVR